jgi:hypothetical protein
MEKEEPPISWKDGLILIGLGAISLWLLIKGEREDADDKKPANP